MKQQNYKMSNKAIRRCDLVSSHLQKPPEDTITLSKMDGQPNGATSTISRRAQRTEKSSSHLQKPPEDATTLCFLDAFHAQERGDITWDEYLRHLLVHLTGVEHKEDDRDGLYPALRYTDPFGYGIWCWSRDLERKVTSKQSPLYTSVNS